MTTSEDNDSIDLERMQANYIREKQERSNQDLEQAVSDSNALCFLVRLGLPKDMRDNCTPDALTMLETFRAVKANPENRFHPAWRRERIAQFISDAVNESNRGIVSLKSPLKIEDGKPLISNQLKVRRKAFNKLRETLISAQDDPVFAFLKNNQTSNSFEEAQYRAVWGAAPVGNKVSQEHDETAGTAAKMILGNGADTFGHLLNYLDHINQVETEFPIVRETKYDVQKVFIHSSLKSIAYVADSVPAADLTLAEIFMGKAGLITALHSFCIHFYDLIDLDNVGATKRSLGERAKDWLGKPYLERISKDFPNS